MFEGWIKKKSRLKNCKTEINKDLETRLGNNSMSASSVVSSNYFITFENNL